jgi:hypothetical protein
LALELSEKFELVSEKTCRIKFKKYAAKAGKEVANGLSGILINILSESVKNQSGVNI